MRFTKRFGAIFFVAVLIATALLLAAAPAAWATEIRGGDTVTIGAGETVNEDLYLAGNRIVVDGTVDGDLIATGTDIVINGVVTGDVLGASQSLIINGTVEDDVRFAGTVVRISGGAQVGDEIMSAGYALVLEPGSQVGGDVTFVGGQVVIDGEVGGDLNTNAGGVAFNGAVGGNADITTDSQGEQPAFSPFQFMPNAPDVPLLVPGLDVGQDARVGGTLNLTVPTEAAVGDLPPGLDPTVEVTGVPEEPEENPLLRFLSDFVGRFLVLIIAAAIVMWLAGRLLQESALQLRVQPWPSLGWGAVIYFLFPLLLLAVAFAAGLFMALLGAIGLDGVGSALFIATLLVLGAALMIFIVVLAIVSKLVVGKAIGDWLFRSQENPNSWLVMAAGLAIVSLLVELPYAGPVLNLLLTIAGVGGLWLAFREPQETAVMEKELLEQ